MGLVCHGAGAQRMVLSVIEFSPRMRYLVLNIVHRGESQMSNYNKLTIELEVGQKILVGKNRTPAEITKIEYHQRSGDIELKTTRGSRKALTFSICDAEVQ